jgi:hopanoid biosynthesis associated protein HpnK
VKRLIVTADDFGLALPVNEAVERAHREGVLTAASLMVGAPAAADAVARARRMPGLRVGLHLVVVEGRPLLPASALPDLVDARGELPTALFAAGLRFFLHAGAQFEAFRATGLRLDHVNAHNHMHLHPTVLGICLRVGPDFGMRAVRVPWEPLPRSGVGRGERIVRLALAPWVAWLRRRLRRAGLRTNDFVLGLRDSGQLDEARVLELISALPDGTGELYFHLATRSDPELLRRAPGYRHEAELAAALSPRVRAELARCGVQLSGFSDLPGDPL